MALLKAVYEKQDEIPEAFGELYTERGGKFELTGVEGVKTQADFDRVHVGLTKERAEHKAAKEKLAKWGDLVYEDVRSQLDQIEELRLKAESSADPKKNEALIEAAVRTRTLPLERERDGLKSKLEEATKALGEATQREKIRKIHDAVRAARIKAKVLDTAEEDLLIYAERVMDVDEQGRAVTKDNVGVTPGLEADALLMELQPKRPHWWPPSEGGGSKGGQGNGGLNGANPWKTDNLTEQLRFITQHGREKAAQMAKAAGKQLFAIPGAK